MGIIIRHGEGARWEWRVATEAISWGWVSKPEMVSSLIDEGGLPLTNHLLRMDWITEKLKAELVIQPRSKYSLPGNLQQ
jgi:hypothetical protein